MAYEVLARKWRPQTFDEVVGQDHVTRTLANAIEAKRLAHSFLFCGPRGVGKTTAARILAKCLNCETATDGPVVKPCGTCNPCIEIAQGRSLDVLEIDGASNRGIDEIRDLRENVRYAPAGGRAKVYIIDEVHMLTKEAFNALLKTLEEPPPSVYFVFATTEAHRVPPTIVSRCQKYDFHRISTEMIAETLARLAKREKFTVDAETLAELARLADGGLRDAESLLDQAAAVGGGTVTLDGLRDLLGEVKDDVYLRIVSAAISSDTAATFTGLQEMLDRGMDPSRVAVGITQALRDLLVVQSASGKATDLGVRVDLVDSYRAVAEGVSPAKLTAFLTLASRAVSDLRRSARPRLTLEVALARLCRLEDPDDMASLVDRLERLRADLGGDDGSGPPARPHRPTGPVAPAEAPPATPSSSSSSSRASSSRRAGTGKTRAEHVSTGSAAVAVPQSPSGDEPPPIGELEARPDVSARDASPPGAMSATAAPSTDDQRVWSDLIRRIRGRKVMLASFLEHGALQSVEDGDVTAVFENTYYEGMVGRRDNLAIIHEELAHMMGKSASFRVKLGALPLNGSRPVAEPEEGKARSAQSKDLLAENPGLNRIIHELGGQLMPGGNQFGGGA